MHIYNFKAFKKMSILKDWLKFSPEVMHALKNKLPVVSLESTIISHGMPYPNNKHCALEVEQIVRKGGAIPATIALMHGKICIGLSNNDIEELAQSDGKSRKTSRRDIPYVLAKKGLGSTTVAGTMICSALAGIDIFVTGGLGGVHRDYQQTMDVSADLRELGRTPVSVVSAGVKNILDIPRTLEYLQTEGVPVVTYQSKYFPAFFSPSSNIASPFRMDSITEIAEMLSIRKDLNLQNGVLIGVPAQQSQNGAIIEAAINRALKQAHEQGIKGAATTPFLLKKVHEYSNGISIKANINLIKRNAELGTTIAVQYARLRRQKQSPKFCMSSQTVDCNKSQKNNCSSNQKGNCSNPSKNSCGTNKNLSSNKIIVLGGSAIDFQVRIVDGKFELYQTSKGSWKTGYGGVGRNIAEVCQKLGAQAVLVTAVGSDKNSEQLKNHISSLGIDLYTVKQENVKAPTYLGILDDKNDVALAIGDMDANDSLTFDKIYEAFFKQEEKKGINNGDIVVVDANLVSEGQSLLKLLKYLQSKGYFVIYECKGKKAVKIVRDEAYRYVSILKMNEKERETIINQLRQKGVLANQQNQYDWFSKNIGSSKQNQNPFGINTIITDGDKNIRLISTSGQVKQITPIKSNNVKKTTGAGDTLTGTLCTLLLKGHQFEQAIKIGTIASKMTVESYGISTPVAAELSMKTLIQQYRKSRASQVA